MNVANNTLTRLLSITILSVFSAVSFAGDPGSFSDDYLTTGDFVIKNITVIDGLGNGTCQPVSDSHIVDNIYFT